MNKSENKMRRGTALKYKAIQNRFEVLYNVQRLRYDDVIDKLMEEFFITERTTIHRIMRINVPDVPPEVDPKQLNIFHAGVPDVIEIPLGATG